jgi:hypothetical protein
VNPYGMRGFWLGLLSIAMLAAAPAGAGAKEKDKPKPAVAAPSATSVWEPLVAPGARFVLVDGGASARIVVESYDARVVHGAKVARLRWLVEDGGARSPMGNSLPTQIAVSKKGAWLLTERLDDDAITKALKGKPTFADPPRPIENDDGYVRKQGGSVCIGIGTPPGKPCPAGVCHAEYCLAPGVGLTAVSGNYTPSAGAYLAPAPSQTSGLDLHTGVPDCDAFLNDWARCAAEVNPPDMRDQLNEALRQMADAYRQQASTPDGAKQAAEVCRMVAPQMTSALRDMGCKI